MNSFTLATLALLVENLFGYPKFLQSHVGHPVQWMGSLVTILEDRFNSRTTVESDGRTEGLTALAILLLCAGAPAILIATALSYVPYGWVINVLLATTLIAQKSMRDHTEAVANALGRSLAEARSEVGKIVGRDTSTLDESGVTKAALESLAENTADGIVAPALYYAIAGLPGIAIYKAINTADSMIGHKSAQYLHFGWAAAKLDDLVNWPAARLCGGLFVLSAWFQSKAAMRSAWAMMWRDAAKHHSPNAGWPEAAMAGALDLQFGGPRAYEDETHDLPSLGDGRATMTAADIPRGLAIFDRSLLLLASMFALVAVFL
jgi:adenosylcobinamide-phosphate synthase